MHVTVVNSGTPTVPPDADGPITPADLTATGDQPVNEEAGVDGQPGFGIGTALVALLTSLALRAHRH